MSHVAIAGLAGLESNLSARDTRVMSVRPTPLEPEALQLRVLNLTMGRPSRGSPYPRVVSRGEVRCVSGT